MNSIENMKICVAQTKPVKGDIQKNIENHKRFIELAIENNSDIIVFPELSITGYEADLVKELAITKDDTRINEFQKISDANNIIIGIGVPTKNDAGINISMLLLLPNKPRMLYAKKYLHPGEEKYFVPGENIDPISVKNNKVAFAICYETSIAEHSEKAFKDEANIYIASVLNSVGGVDKDIDRIANTAKKYKMISLMSNFVGISGGYDCAGKSSVWSNEGVLLAQLDDVNEGIIIIDANTQKTIKIQL